LKTKTTVLSFAPEQPLDNARLAALCGPMDENLRQISKALDVSLFRRAGQFIVSGDNAAQAVAILEKFYHSKQKVISIDEVQLALVEQRSTAAFAQDQAMITSPSLITSNGVVARLHSATGFNLNTQSTSKSTAESTAASTPALLSPILKTRRSELRGRTPHQIAYLNAIMEHDVTFGVGPAGTGKTYLAVACAVDALERDAVKRIILTRPAVEAGEKLGFLPGDLTQKVDPYLRPLYDALYDLLGVDRTQKMFDKQAIEIAPLAYMRGRTLNHAFVILDEAQNTTPEQMKMFLTRIGFGSKAVITGDTTQIDLQRGQKSGLIDASRILSNVRGIAFTHFSSVDVVRHPLVARIVDAYESDHENSTTTTDHPTDQPKQTTQRPAKK
jgi:phosphate starvation-inducible PhoH-like protein